MANIVLTQCNLYVCLFHLILFRVTVLSILHIHVTSPTLGERISAIILTQQRKQWLSIELNRWRSERIHCYFLNNKKQNINNYNVNMHDYYN